MAEVPEIAEGLPLHELKQRGIVEIARPFGHGLSPNAAVEARQCKRGRPAVKRAIQTA